MAAAHYGGGLRKLSPDLVEKASDETATQVVRIGWTFVATATFCLLSLLSPDSALLGGSKKINVPLAGPISFFGFMLLGPTILIVLRIYLQIYVEHNDRLNCLARRLPLPEPVTLGSRAPARAPTLLPLKNPLIRVFSALTFYLLLPVVMLVFTWKAAVFPIWGSGLLCVATGVIVSHALLPFSRCSWRSRMLLSLTGALLVGGIFAGRALLGFEPLRRPLNLLHATLSDQVMAGDDLRDAQLALSNLSGAYLMFANLSGANLGKANLSGTYLIKANLSKADFSYADLSKANLTYANLNGANLSSADLKEADLTGANLSGANLISARGLTQTQLSLACGRADTKLPDGIAIKPCPED